MQDDTPYTSSVEGLEARLAELQRTVLERSIGSWAEMPLPRLHEAEVRDCTEGQTLPGVTIPPPPSPRSRPFTQGQKTESACRSSVPRTSQPTGGKPSPPTSYHHVDTRQVFSGGRFAAGKTSNVELDAVLQFDSPKGAVLRCDILPRLTPQRASSTVKDTRVRGRIFSQFVFFCVCVSPLDCGNPV